MSTQIAVIGPGYWGKNLVRIYNQLGALRLVCDKNESILNECHTLYPTVDTCIAFNEVLKREDINGVVIATPAETHYTIAKEVLLANKHVYIEKPMALDIKNAYELQSLAKDKNRILMVGHLLRYHPAFEQLKTLSETNELGRINYIYSNRLNLGKIRREENILWSFAPHDISMILALANEEPESVFAVGGNYLHKRIADVTTTHLDFPSGLKSHIFVSWLHPFKEQKLIVVGDRKMAVFDDTRPWSEKLALYHHKIKWEGRIPIPEKAMPEYIHLNESEPLKNECEHFLHCISTGKTPITDSCEGIRVLKVLNSCQESLDTGKKIILKKQSHTSPHYFVHESSFIDTNVTIQPGTKIWHFSHVLSGSRIGKECNIGQNVMIGSDVIIGDYCKIQNNVSVYKGVTLEAGVFCGPSMVFTNVYNPRATIRKMEQARPTLVKTGATIGANATIVCGITIGCFAFIGAGAVVNKDIPDYALVVGNPAKKIGWVCKCGQRLNDNLLCPECKTQYQHGFNDNQIKPVD